MAKNPKIIKFPKKMRSRNPKTKAHSMVDKGKRANPPVTSIAELTARRNTPAGLQVKTVGQWMLRLDPKDKALIKSHPEYSGIVSGNSTLMQRSLEKMSQEPEFQAWHESREHLSNKYLDPRLRAALSELHEKAVKKRRLFWWDMSKEPGGTLKLSLSYDANLRSDCPPRRLASITLKDRSVGLDVNWDRYSDQYNPRKLTYPQKVLAFYNTRTKSKPKRVLGPQKSLQEGFFGSNKVSGLSNPKKVFNGRAQMTIDHFREVIDNL